MPSEHIYELPADSPGWGFFSHIPAGVGTVIRPDQVLEAKANGAAFAVSPGTSRRVLETAKEAGLFFAPGIATPSDIEAALEYDCRLMKYFPAETSGGLPHLRSMAVPYSYLGVKFIPLAASMKTICKPTLPTR